jgi:ketoreductase RED1
MGGGPKGLESFFQHLGKNMAASFKVNPAVELDENLQQRIIEQAAASFGRTPIPEMERKRDHAQVALLTALSSLAAQGSERKS